MNIFDLRGPEFLALYVEFLLGAIAIGIVFRWALRGPSDSPDPQTLRLDPFELAYLARGERGLVNAAVASLIHRGLLELKGAGALQIIGAETSSLHWCERAVYDRIKGQSSPRLVSVRGAIDAGPIRQKLNAQGLTLDRSRRLSIGLVQASTLSIVLLIGLIKICVGVSRDRPVGFLILLCVVTVVVLRFAARPPLRSRRGDAALEQLRRANATLKTTASANTKTLASSDVVTAFALWGVAMLSGEELARFRSVLKPASGAGWSGGSSCGSGCGGGGGGGGCGGGGCGGCGS